jgi:hypothetical protein
MNRTIPRPAAPRLAALLVVGAAVPLAGTTAPSAGAETPAARVATAAPVAAADARALMQQVEAAARARDVQRLAALLAEDCRIELRTRTAGGEAATKFTKAEYVRMLTSGYAAMGDLRAYDYRIDELHVELDAGGATVRAVVRETAVFDDGTVATRSDEVSRVERRGDAVVLVEVIATTAAAPAKVR